MDRQLHGREGAPEASAANPSASLPVSFWGQSGAT
jgi:hypothetical protein